MGKKIYSVKITKNRIEDGMFLKYLLNAILINTKNSLVRIIFDNL